MFPSFRQSIERIKENPQLLYTLFVAVVIVVSFVFVVNQFVSISQDAQDRLVNVRIGALQSSFVEFADDYFETDNDIQELQDKIRKISVGNSTINEFRVVEFEGDRARIIASLNSGEVGQFDTDNSFIYGIAEVETNTSYTLEEIVDGERFFTTVRVIKDDFQNVVGAVLTTQSLSQADIAINNSIQNSIINFIIIVVVIMILFFRYSKVIDYSTLYKRIKEVDRLKDDFISMASHELRTPLTIIRGYAEELSESGDLNEIQRKSVDRIEIASHQLDNLVNDMLDVSRIEQGRMEFDMKPVNVVESLKDLMLGFEKPAEDKGLHLLFNNLDNSNPQINVDTDKFRQVIVNIVGNAVKYTKEGDIKVNVSLAKDKVEIRVSDSGIGMSEEERKNLFQKFYRVKNEETHEIRGTGLGLWITKQIVEKMNGKISVESIKGVGTHFIVTFPQAK